ncbi:MAG: ABC transporter permease [Polyangiaceae bacterium]
MAARGRPGRAATAKRIFIVARREFLATVLTRGFVVGVLLMPTIMGLVMAAVPLLVRSPPVRGEVAIIDRTGRVAVGAAERIANLDRDGESSPGARRRRQGGAPPANLRVVVLADDADVEAATAPLRQLPAPERLALVVIPADGLAPEKSPDLLCAPTLDGLLGIAVGEQVADAVIDARLAERGHDPEAMRALLQRPKISKRTVTASGDAESDELAGVVLPAAFMMLLWIATFTSGQFLLTTLVEEKSMRVMEVLLSAVSPFELLTGKIIGHALVGMVVLATYLALGTTILVGLDMSHMLDPALAALLGVYFVIAFLLVASMMAAVGSVVEDIRSAQTLLTPVMVLLALPTVLWLPISRNPSSTFAIVLTFIPPMGPFVSVLRLAAPDPVPAWQVALSLAIGVASVIVAIWAAARIFRIGVLMYGKPPTLRQMLRWVRER